MTERTVTIEGGDTLYDIAKREYGDGNKWPKLFDANRDVIIAEQRKRQANRSRYSRPLDMFPPQDWIFPGTVLHVPN